VPAEAIAIPPERREPALDGQQRVDRIQAALRAGADVHGQSAQAPGAVDPIELRIAAELAHVKRMLDAVTGELMDDIDILTRHAQALQSCDIAAAIVDSLAEVMAAADRDRAIAAVPMHEVRTRLSGQTPAG
jgi:hypothetical protein